jgi:hypothetical protein
MRLKQLVADSGEGNWNRKAEHFPGRDQRQLRERWLNYLSPGPERPTWTHQEDEQLRKLVRENGQRWSTFRHYFIGRTDVHIKNRWAVLKAQDNKKATSVTDVMEDEVSYVDELEFTNTSFGDLEF